jgi:uncharacterized membrane protein
MSATTIKVSKDLRDRIARRAAAEGLTAGELITRLLDERDRQVRLAAVRAAYAERDASYDAETQAWDAAAGDGLA